jgi:ribosomal protein S18 acetylase RimI-like enzyme
MNIAENVDIVATDVDDIELIRPLWEQLNEHNRALHKGCFGEGLHRTWVEFLEQLTQRSHECGIRFDVVRSHQALVGYCLSSINTRSEGEIVSLFVLPEFRGRGIGYSLMRQHIEWFRENCVKSMYLYVHPCNVDAIRFYWRFRFFSSSPLMELCETERDSSEGTCCVSQGASRNGH